MKILQNLSAIKFPLLLVLTAGIFFWPLFVSGRIPLPADTIVGMYHPWRDVVWDGYVSGVPYKNFLITDPVRQQYIWKKLAIDQYKQFQWPLWNPFTHAGMPLLANFQTGAFYPLNILFIFLPFNSAWSVYIFIQPLLAGLFMYFFLKNKQLNVLSSFFGSILIMFSGFFTAWMEWGNIGHTILWLPLLLLAIDKLSVRTSRKWFVICLSVLIFQFFAGHIQTSFYVIGFSAVYALYKSLNKPDKEKNTKFIMLFPLIFSLFAVLTAIQWLPTLELLHYSNRTTDIINTLTRNDWFLPPQNIVQLFVPDFFGNPATLNYWGEWNYIEFVSFIGLVPLLFVAVSLSKILKDNRVRLWWLATVIILSFALKTPWSQLPYILNLPFISSAQPSRIICLFDFCLAVLAAYGFEIFLHEGKRGFKKILMPFLGILITFGSVWLFIITAGKLFPGASWLPGLAVSKRNIIFPSIILAGCTVLLLSGAIIRKKSFYIIITAGLILLSLLDFYRFFSKYTPFVSADWIFPETNTIAFLKKNGDLFRFMSTDRSLMPSNFSAYYGLQSISGYDPLYLKDFAQLITKMESGKDGSIASFNRIIEPENYRSMLADELGAKYILTFDEIKDQKLVKVFSEGKTNVYENLLALPKARLSITQESTVNIQKYSPNVINLNVKTQKVNELLINDMYYPGWWSNVGGVVQPVEKSAGGTKLIRLPAGNYSMTVYYQPRSFILGSLVTLAGIGLLMFILLFRKAKLIL